jgi:hypothetical protein
MEAHMADPTIETATTARANPDRREQLRKERRDQYSTAIWAAIEHHKSATGQVADNKSLLTTAGEILEFLKTGDTEVAAPETAPAA